MIQKLVALYCSKMNKRRLLQRKDKNQLTWTIFKVCSLMLETRHLTLKPYFRNIEAKMTWIMEHIQSTVFDEKLSRESISINSDPLLSWTGAFRVQQCHKDLILHNDHLRSKLMWAKCESIQRLSRILVKHQKDWRLFKFHRNHQSQELNLDIWTS